MTWRTARWYATHVPPPQQGVADGGAPLARWRVSEHQSPSLGLGALQTRRAASSVGRPEKTIATPPHLISRWRSSNTAASFSQRGRYRSLGAASSVGEPEKAGYMVLLKVESLVGRRPTRGTSQIYSRGGQEADSWSPVCPLSNTGYSS